VEPETEKCADSLDNDCDGATDEDCTCTAGESQACGTSECPGTQVCDGQGNWGECSGVDLCGTPQDDLIIEGGCSCGSTGPGGSILAWLGLTLVVVGQRRRNSQWR
jgi:uncharacterized protein (TIGR03382 family)